HLAERLAEVLVRHRMWRRRIERPIDRGMIEGKQDQPNLVLVVNPAHVLLARSDWTADAHFEGRQHLGEGAAILVKHDTGPKADNADAVNHRRLRRLLPIDTDPGQEIVAGEAVVG